MEKARLERIAGKENLVETERTPLRLHYVENREILEGYLIRLRSRIIDGYYDKEIVDLMFLVAECSTKRMQQAQNSTPSWNLREKRRLVGQKLDKMTLAQINSFANKVTDKFFQDKFICRMEYELAHSPIVKDSLFKGLYTADQLLTGPGTRSLTVVEEQVYAMIGRASSKWGYEFVNDNKLHIVDRNSESFSIDLHIDMMCKRVDEVILNLDDEKINSRVAKQEKELHKSVKKKRSPQRTYVRREVVSATV